MHPERKDTAIDTVLPSGANSIYAVVDITLSNLSIFRKAQWTQ